MHKQKEKQTLDEGNVLYLCMGSACHRLGVYEILPKLQALITDHNLDGKVALKGHFCLGNCADGVIISLGDRAFERVFPENVERVFVEEILPVIKSRIS